MKKIILLSIVLLSISTFGQKAKGKLKLENYNYQLQPIFMQTDTVCVNQNLNDYKIALHQSRAKYYAKDMQYTQDDHVKALRVYITAKDKKLTRGDVSVRKETEKRGEENVTINYYNYAIHTSMDIEIQIYYGTEADKTLLLDSTFAVKNTDHFPANYIKEHPKGYLSRNLLNLKWNDIAQVSNAYEDFKNKNFEKYFSKAKSVKVAPFTNYFIGNSTVKLEVPVQKIKSKNELFEITTQAEAELRAGFDTIKSHDKAFRKENLKGKNWHNEVALVHFKKSFELYKKAYDQELWQYTKKEEDQKELKIGIIISSYISAICANDPENAKFFYELIQNEISLNTNGIRHYLNYAKQVIPYFERENIHFTEQHFKAYGLK